MSLWIVGIILALLFFFLVLIIVIVAIVLIARKRGKAKAGAPGLNDGGRPQAPVLTPAPAPAPSPSPSAFAPAGSGAAGAHNPSPSPPPPPPPPPPTPFPNIPAGDQGMTVDLSRTVAITDADVFPIDHGSIAFVSGPLSGQEFQIKTDGEYIGRDSASAQIVVPDPRISKKHLWIGVKNGRVVIEDQNSRNGTFVNDPKTDRVTETSLSYGDVVILGESDVARFEYRE